MEVIAVIFNFSVVVFILWYAGRKPVMQFLANRAQSVGQQMKEASELSASAQKELSQWQARWNQTEAESRQLFEDAKKSAESFRAATIAHARSEAERIRKEAVLAGQSEAVKAEQRLRHELVHTSVTMARNYLSSHLEEKDKHNLVTEYLETVPNGHAR